MHAAGRHSGIAALPLQASSSSQQPPKAQLPLFSPPSLTAGGRSQFSSAAVATGQPVTVQCVPPVSNAQAELSELLQRSRLLAQLLQPGTRLSEQQLEVVQAALRQQKQQRQQQQPQLEAGPTVLQPGQRSSQLVDPSGRPIVQQPGLRPAAVMAQLVQQPPAGPSARPQGFLPHPQLLQLQQMNPQSPVVLQQQQQQLLQAASLWQQQRGGLPAFGAGLIGAGLGLMQQQPSLYMAALERGHAIMAHNWQTATNKQRDTAWAQFDHWSWQQLGKPGQYCHPNDIVVYLESCFLHQHGRQTAADGTSCPAPSTVSSTVAHLSTRLQQLGCRGPWDWVTCSGNPCNSMEVRTFKGGYSNEMQELGFSPTAAKPLSEDKLQQLVQCLAAEAAEAQQRADQPWYVAVLLWRDACITQYLWDSKRRPAELSKTQTAQVEVTSSAVGSSRVQAHPQISKMCHASQGSRVPRPVDVQGPAGQQLASLLLQYMQCVQQSGRGLGRYLFSPLHPSRLMLQTEQGLSTAAMGQRIIGHLKRLGLYEGESLYSIKRGAMQHDFFVAGKSLAAIGTAADIDTMAVVQAYVDPTRHL